MGRRPKQIFFVLEKDSRFMKYHAMQSIIVWLAFTIRLVRAADDSHHWLDDLAACSWAASSSILLIVKAYNEKSSRCR